MSKEQEKIDQLAQRLQVKRTKAGEKIEMPINYLGYSLTDLLCALADLAEGKTPEKKAKAAMSAVKLSKLTEHRDSFD